MCHCYKGFLFFIITFLLGVGLMPGQIQLALNGSDDLAIETVSTPRSSSQLLLTWNLDWKQIITTSTPLLPTGSQPILLRISFPNDQPVISENELDLLALFLQNNPTIARIILAVDTSGKEPGQLSHILKQVSCLIRGKNSQMTFALESIHLEQLLDLIVAENLGSYLDALVMASTDSALQDKVLTTLPELKIWERVGLPDPAPFTPEQLITALLSRPIFMANTTPLYIFDTPVTPTLLTILGNLMPFLNAGLIDRLETVDMMDEKNFFRQLPLYYKQDGVSPVILAIIDREGKREFPLATGVYEIALITNLYSGEQTSQKLGKNAQMLKVHLIPSIYVFELQPRETLKRQVIEVGIRADRPLTADEIVAKVRAWMSVQKRRTHSFTADMSVAYSLKFGNINETFDMLIRGPYFWMRGEASDWVQQEFFLNRIKWKSKKTPKIPLLQPEKVNVSPLEIDLSEKYIYHRDHDDTWQGEAVYVVSFKPQPSYKEQAMYQGRLWIRKPDSALVKKELTQLNLKGEVLSSVETHYLTPCKDDPQTWLTSRISGHQIFNIAGSNTHIEKQVEFENLHLNPDDFALQRDTARQSDFRMVRDTDQGLRYLVKDEKTGQRTVEWQQGKSQTAAIFGGFYDSSYSFPLPLAGINYLNFDIGGKGKGRQTNILFGGALLMANYTDPSLFGTGISFGANLNGIAFSSKNKLYRNKKPFTQETIREQTFRSNISLGFTLSSAIKLTTQLYADYTFFSEQKEDTCPQFVLPHDGLTYGARFRLEGDFKGYSLAVWGDFGQRDHWDFWGLPENNDYHSNQRNFFRWRVIAAKDFNLSNFRKIGVKATWLDGLRLDRFSAYKFGFFSELRISGFNSGSIRAERALMLNLSYGYQLGQSFGLEIKYDSILLSNRLEDIHNHYFSGVALSVSTALPIWDNLLIKFEAGLPVVSHGIKGFVLNLMLLKMF